MNREIEKLVIRNFIDNPTSRMMDISDATGVSKSSVQRILNKKEYCDIEIPSTGRTISEQLKINLIMARRKGGNNFFKNNVALKDSSGKFIGSIKNTDITDNEEEKRQDIKKIVQYFVHNSFLTLEEITTNLNESLGKNYTKDYVYDCLLDSRVEEMFGSSVSEIIAIQLEKHKSTFYKKFKDVLHIDIFNIGVLDENEYSVLFYRFNNGAIRNYEEVAQHFNCSEDIIIKIEDEALDKIKQYIKEQKRI